MVKNQGTKQRGQRTLRDCWQWKANGQCSKGDSCSFLHDINKRAKKQHSRILLRALLRGRMREMHREPEVREARVPVEECYDCPSRIASKELAPILFVKNGILQNACSTSRTIDADLWKSVFTHTARLMNSQAKGRKRMVTEVQWLY